MRLVIRSLIGEEFSTSLDFEPKKSIGQIKIVVCKKNNIQEENTCLVLHGEVIDEGKTISELGIQYKDTLALVPRDITCAVNENELISEYRYLRTQFPLVKMVDLMTYQGKLRCDRGYVKELADQGVWPFTEYVKWHEFKMVLSYLHPYKPPTVTWLTDISHPNIIPQKKGKVCVSILGKKWLPNTKLAAVINALYFLLADPNPYSAYPNKRCKEVAKICRMYGFPLLRSGTTYVPSSIQR